MVGQTRCLIALSKKEMEIGMIFGIEEIVSYYGLQKRYSFFKYPNKHNTLNNIISFS